MSTRYSVCGGRMWHMVPHSTYVRYGYIIFSVLWQNVIHVPTFHSCETHGYTLLSVWWQNVTHVPTSYKWERRGFTILGVWRQNVLLPRARWIFHLVMEPRRIVQSLIIIKSLYLVLLRPISYSQSLVAAVSLFNLMRVYCTGNYLKRQGRSAPGN